jgi:hypothetical protein
MRAPEKLQQKTHPLKVAFSAVREIEPFIWVCVCAPLRHLGERISYCRLICRGRYPN